MPELPEVETTRLGIIQALENKQLKRCYVHDSRLRWPVPSDLSEMIDGNCLQSINRRGKYLLFDFAHGHVLLHLGMSGRLQLFEQEPPPRLKHDHIEFYFANDYCLRFNDPRRFGCCLWIETEPQTHALLKDLGPEPLTEDFNSNYLKSRLTGSRTPIKTALMNSKIVVGVGNIYANEALFLAGIDPKRPASSLDILKIEALVTAVKEVLNAAITAGGTTLADYRQTDGSLGYFSMQLNVYGRGGQACVRCHQQLTETRLSQRTTVFCSQCQR